MFDMLDDDDLDVGYVPTVPNSRSKSMKKLTKKEPKSVPKEQPPAKTPPKKNDFDFDELMDDDPLDLLDKQLGPTPNKNKSIVGGTKANKSKFSDNFDDLLDEPRAPSLDKTKQINKKDTPSILDTFGKTTNRLQLSDEIISEDQSGFGRSNNYNRNASVSPPVNKDDDTPFVSSRNMKPPMRKKKEGSSTNIGGASTSIGLTLPSEPVNINSNKYEDDEVIRPPPRLMSRRSSVEKSEKDKDEGPPLVLNQSPNKPQDSSPNFLSLQPKTGIKKETSHESKPSLTLSLDKPQKEKQQLFKPPPKPQPSVGSYKSINQGLRLPGQDSVSLAPPPQIEKSKNKPTTGLDLTVEQSIAMKESPNQASFKATIEDQQKQMQHLKMTYQKQIDFLQLNLDKQINANRETREKLMRETNKMIEEERSRTRKVHQEQLQRAKEMLEWEKKRMEETYQGQVQNLQRSLQQATKMQVLKAPSSSGSKNNLQYLQGQLRNQKRIVEDRERILEQRQLQLEERELEMRRKRKEEEDRLRNEERRIIEMEAKYKRQLTEQKRHLMEEKQQVAIEMANLEMELVRKRERMDQFGKQNEQDRGAIDKERLELRHLTSEMMSRYKVKSDELQRERERVRAIEQDLLTKMRVVEARLREAPPRPPSNPNQTMYAPKNNNWVNDSHNRTSNISMDRQRRHDKSQERLNRTKGRFNDMSEKSREGGQWVAKENKKFDLEDYMNAVESYNRARA